MKHGLTAFLLIILFSSCSRQNNFPEKISYKIPFEELVLPVNLNNTQINESSVSVDFSDLNYYSSQFELKEEKFNLAEFENEWNSFLEENNNKSQWNDTDLKTWAEITGLLLELTNKAKYAEELESISNNAGNELRQTMAPYILTKRIDHIYVNIFQPIEINYNHTLGGEVKFRQETDYPKSGIVRLHFGMTERRYIELYIRIPDWADSSTVIVKQVKYFAPPGSYCRIGKKWNEGDVVDIEFSKGQFPKNN